MCHEDNKKVNNAWLTPHLIVNKKYRIVMCILQHSLNLLNDTSLIMNYKFAIILLNFLCSIIYLNAQPQFVKQEKPDPKFARWCVEYGNYYDGLLEYQRLLKEDSSEVIYHYHLGLCYLNLNIDKTKAIPWLEWTVKQDKFDENAWYFLGMAYLVNNRIDEAITSFKTYQNKTKVDLQRVPAKRMIEMCFNAKTLQKTPENVEIQNLGKYINSDEPDYNPYIPSNESMLIFNSQRKENFGNYRNMDGFYPADIYVSYYKFGKWKKVGKLNTVINSSNIEEAVGYTADGSTMFINTAIVMDGEKGSVFTEKKGKNYGVGQTLLIQGFEKDKIHSFALSLDKKLLLFSCQKENGIGGKDIYISRILPDGSWGKPILADSNINSIYDDNFPFFGADGYVYFASEGFNSMGGYDLFKTKLNKTSLSFSKPINLGYPVNTTQDDKTISVSATGRYAYISSLREGGEGDLDIYRVIFKDAPPTYTLIRGKSMIGDSLPFSEAVKARNKVIDSLNMPIYEKYKQLLSTKDSLKGKQIWENRIMHEKNAISITAYDQQSNKVFGHYIVKESSSNYAVILPPGNWTLIFKRKGYKDIEIKNLSIEERDLRNKEIIQNILFEPQASN